VTGGAGFIGSHVVDQLVDEGYSVRVVDNLRTGNLANICRHVDQGLVDFVKADVLDRDVVSKVVHDVETVVHLAAIVSVPFSLENPRLTYEVNVEGTRGLLESCVRSGGNKFIFASSSSVYGAPRYLPIDEVHPTCPISPYAASKLEGEGCCSEFDSGSDLDMFAFRLFNVYGSRQVSGDYSGVITKFMENAEKNAPLVIYGDGWQTRDFVHVTDVADAVLKVMQDDYVGGTFNIGYGKAVSVNDLAKTVLNLSARDCGIVHDAPRNGDILHSIADVSKAQRTFGYEPKMGLEEGLQELLFNRRGSVR
jgi:UDP-glucose 4-epimerase